MTGSKKIKVCLVRHGETDWNKENKIQGKNDVPLNSTGFEQADAAGKQLEYKNVQCIYSSPLKRAEQTAEIIQKRLGGNIKIGTVSSLKEDDLGSIEGEEIKNMGSDVAFERIKSFKKKNRCFPDWMENMIKDLNKSVLDICEKTPYDTIAIVTHKVVLLSVLIACNFPDTSLPSNGEIIEAEYCDGKFSIIKRTKPEQTLLKNISMAVEEVPEGIQYTDSHDL